MINEVGFRKCPGCSASYSISSDACDKYGVMSRECYQAFLAILAYEHKRYRTPLVHRLLIDACVVQHPPHLDVQIILGIEKHLILASVQAISVHLIALFLAIERRLELAKVSKEMETIIANIVKNKVEFLELQPPSSLGAIKILDIWKSVTEQHLTLDDYSGLILKFADSAWDAWSPHHATVRRLYEKYK